MTIGELMSGEYQDKVFLVASYDAELWIQEADIESLELGPQGNTIETAQRVDIYSRRPVEARRSRRVISSDVVKGSEIEAELVKHSRPFSAIVSVGFLTGSMAGRMMWEGLGESIGEEARGAAL